MRKEDKQSHIAEWSSSGKSKKAYCLEKGIKYATFLYWIKTRERTTDTDVEGKGKFVRLPSFSTEKTLEVVLPNGLRIYNASLSDIDLIRALYGI